MSRGFGTADQGDGQQRGGGNFGVILDGTHALSFAWDIQNFEANQHGPGGPKLRLHVTGGGVTERLSGGSGKGVVLEAGGKGIDDKTDASWKPNPSTKASAFIRNLEDALGYPLSNSWSNHDGMLATVKRKRYDGMVGTGGDPTIPVVISVQSDPSKGQNATQAGHTAPAPAQVPLGPPTLPVPPPAPAAAALPPAPAVNATLTTAAVEAIATMLGLVPAVDMGQVEPEQLANYVPASITDGTDRVGVVRLLLDPAFLATAVSWAYDASGNIVSRKA